jgi:hypothetical protein
VRREIVADPQLGMSICPNTGISIPECACAHCLQRQVEEFAPELMRVRRRNHDPLRIEEVRSARVLPPVSERLKRPRL